MVPSHLGRRDCFSELHTLKESLYHLRSEAQPRQSTTRDLTQLLPTYTIQAPRRHLPALLCHQNKRDNMSPLMSEMNTSLYRKDLSSGNAWVRKKTNWSNFVFQHKCNRFLQSTVSFPSNVKHPFSFPVSICSVVKRCVQCLRNILQYQ